MENLVLMNAYTLQLILAICMVVMVLIGLLAFRINDRIQMRVSLLMDNETRIYNRQGFAKYIRRHKKKFKHANLVNVRIVNLGYLYTVYKDKHKMLMEITDTMLKGLSKLETLGRVEFNEFMLLLDSYTKEQLREKCKEISNKLAELYFENYGVYNFKIEFGVYEDPDLNEYQTAIDRCLAIIRYSEIRQNNVWYYSQDVADKIQKLNNVNELKTQALESKQFAAYIQPKVDYKTGKVCGGEVLVRWVDEDHKVIFYPDDFIPLFEQNGFIKKLDFVMFEQTCEFAQTLKQKGFQDIILSVNISKINFDSPTFINDITQIIKKYPSINPTNIEIEITESANMEGSQHLSSIIMSLRQLGYKLAMDDFGKDYSTLGSLVNCPYDTIKMDMFFFRNRLSTEKEKDIATNVLNLLSKLNVEIVCEGIEDENTINILGTVTHDFVIQGYYISKPIPISQFEPFLRTHYDFQYPEIQGIRAASGKPAPKVVQSKDVKDSNIERPSLQNDEISSLKAQLAQMKDLIENNKREAEEKRKNSELDNLKEEIRRLKSAPQNNNDEREIQRLKDELQNLKDSRTNDIRNNEYFDLQRQIDDLKHRQTYQQSAPQDSTNKDQIALMIERLKMANKEQFDKLNEENKKTNEVLKAQLEAAQKEREEFKRLLEEKESKNEAINPIDNKSLEDEARIREQEEANKNLDLTLDEFDESDDVDDLVDESGYKPTRTKSEINSLIKSYKEKYGANWVDKAQKEMDEDQFLSLKDDIKYYNEHETKPFRDRILSGAPEQKKLYNMVKNEFMKYEGVSYKLTNSYDQIYLNKELIAQISTTFKRLKLYLALDPKEYSTRTYPHEDLSNKKNHAKTPFYMKVNSTIQYKRFLKLVSEIMEKGSANVNDQYKPFDYVNSLKYEQ